MVQTRRIRRGALLAGRFLLGVSALLFGLLGGVAVAAAPNGDGASTTAATCTTTVGGLITTDTIWTAAGSPYCVTATVDVASGTTLTIQPSVVVQFSAAQALQIDGELIARGSTTRPIRFTSAAATPAKGDWKQILFTPSSVGATFDGNGNYLAGSIVQYAAVQYAGSGTTIESGAIQSTATGFGSPAPFVDHDIIANNLSDGVQLGGEATHVTNNKVTSNGIAGIAMANGIDVNGYQSVTIAGNTVSGNLNLGIGVGGTGSNNSLGTEMIVANNTVSGNGQWGIGGGSGGYLTISGNTISGNHNSGIFPAETNLAITGNTIIGNSTTTSHASGIDLICVGNVTVSNNLIANNRSSQSGGSINLQECGFGSSTTISGNTITGNSSGGGAGGVNVFFGNCCQSVAITDNGISNNVGGGLAITGKFNVVTIAGNVITNNWGGNVSLCDGCRQALNNNDIYGGKVGSPTSFTAVDVINSNPPTTAENATNNYWGTTNPSVISSHILGSPVNFTPFLTSSIPLPDLTVIAITNPPVKANPGSSFNVTATTANGGNASAGASTTRFYLSTTLTKGTGALLLQGSQAMPALGPAATSEATVLEIIPKTATAGTYYLLGCADDTRAVVESREANNCFASTGQVQVP